MTVHEQSMRTNLRRPFLNWKTLAAFVLGFALYPVLMLFPNPFFQNQAHPKNIAVYSDRSISPALFPLLDDPGRQQRVFICDSTFLIVLFANSGSHVGGANKALLNPCILLRGADIQRNRLIDPSRTEVPRERTLVYFISHEIADTPEENRLGRYDDLRLPAWKREGYADYVAQDHRFVFSEQRPAYQRDAFEMNPKRLDLYLRYQLFVTYVVDQDHVTPQKMLIGHMAERAMDQRLRAMQTE